MAERKNSAGNESRSDRMKSKTREERPGEENDSKISIIVKDVLGNWGVTVTNGRVRHMAKPVPIDKISFPPDGWSSSAASEVSRILLI
jgi:hypothetical protein